MKLGAMVFALPAPAEAELGCCLHLLRCLLTPDCAHAKQQSELGSRRQTSHAHNFSVLAREAEPASTLAMLAKQKYFRRPQLVQAVFA